MASVQGAPSILENMEQFEADDGTALAFRTKGKGEPVVCLAGGPGADTGTLGTLGGLDRHRTLIFPDLRGTGSSGTSPERASYAFTAQARDVDALRRHLGLGRIDVLAHSAGALTAQQYAAQFSGGVGKLVLVTPAGRAAREVDEAEVAQLREQRRELPWPAEALEYGTWTRAAREHAQTSWSEPPPWYRAAFYDTDPQRALAALQSLRTAVLVVAGTHDRIAGIRPAERVAAQHPASRLVVLAGAGHFPWIDVSEPFRSLVAGFIDG